MLGSAVTSAFTEPGFILEIFALFVRSSYCTFYDTDNDWQVLLLPFSDDNFRALPCILLRSFLCTSHVVIMYSHFKTKHSFCFVSAINFACLAFQV